MSAQQLSQHSDFWSRFHGPNLGYMYAMYEAYQLDPEAVDPDIRDAFKKWGAPPEAPEEHLLRRDPGVPEQDKDKLAIMTQAEKIAQHIRTYGHLQGKTDPLAREEERDNADFSLEAHGLPSDQLHRMPAELISPYIPNAAHAGEALERLYETYTGTISFEFAHVNNSHEREWLIEAIESGAYVPDLQEHDRKSLLSTLLRVDMFESFMDRTFRGQKRFSAEGIDMIVPMTNELVKQAVSVGICTVNIGMAHRGRLNVLAHVLEKPYELIFAEFLHAHDRDLVPSEGSVGMNDGWTGDVKYHLGADRRLDGQRLSASCRLTLANNPSHLEFVNPVVEGMTREAQEKRHQPGFAHVDENRAMAVLLHGDAAFPGEGVVAETLNLSRLRGYQTGGTIHLIVNNRLGFTTEPEDARSTRYASDLAKGFEIPVVHVNADHPEACLSAVRLAFAYRQRFHKDFLIDLIGYRRFGHNEMDDPAVTQFHLYERIREHARVVDIYSEQLKNRGVITEAFTEEEKQRIRERLQRAYEKTKDVKHNAPTDEHAALENQNKQNGSAADLFSQGPEELPEINTAVSTDRLKKLNDSLLRWPAGYTVYEKLEKILMRRRDAFSDDGAIDWAHAETLAFASILEEGKAIRLTGQDVERGTFAHRHHILHDPLTGKSFSPLHTFADDCASYSIYNTPLSEVSTVGFEYGYDVFAPDTLVLWEAQYGDFANVAQVIFDQFLSSGNAKWGQKSSLVLLLPHGYEGQGPEHSSARLERFLQLSAENNWSVVNMSRAAQYFHVLRRQAAIVAQPQARPLIIMTPKSLLRNKRTVSRAREFSEGTFQPVIEQPETGHDEQQVERMILCSGKVSIDLEEWMDKHRDQAGNWLHIVRIEQLYPFPEQELLAIMQRLRRVREICWVQEEPKNMGAWPFVQDKLRKLASSDVLITYIGRLERSSPAVGSGHVHAREQRRIIQRAMTRQTGTLNLARR